MNREQRREGLIRLHTAKFIHAKMLGYALDDILRAPTRANIHRLQVLINERTKYVPTKPQTP